MASAVARAYSGAGGLIHFGGLQLRLGGLKPPKPNASYVPEIYDFPYHLLVLSEHTGV